MVDPVFGENVNYQDASILRLDAETDSPSFYASQNVVYSLDAQGIFEKVGEIIDEIDVHS